MVKIMHVFHFTPLSSLRLLEFSFPLNIQATLISNLIAVNSKITLGSAAEAVLNN